MRLVNVRRKVDGNALFLSWSIIRDIVLLNFLGNMIGFGLIRPPVTDNEGWLVNCDC